MKTGKEIAKYALSFIGGTPTVNRYYNDNKGKTIDIMACTDSTFKDADVFATLGLAQLGTGLYSDGKEIKVELIYAGESGNQAAGNILASAAFELMDFANRDSTFGHGTIVQGVVRPYAGDASVEHCILLHPVYWDKYQPIVNTDSIITWLLAVPITETEREYILDNGLDAFENRMADANIDICDLHRKSVV